MFPDWWNWELELTSHLEKWMVDRGFNEIDLRMMFENSIDCIRDNVKGVGWSKQNIKRKTGQ
ncbi:MAG: hypothetical protein ACOY90_09290 [Candidatus Zhuqueibacterota bacterium]